MSNFKIYLERVQGNHKAKIETSNFLNENFRNYMKKVFYMEAQTTLPSKTSVSTRINVKNLSGKIGNAAAAVKDESIKHIDI